jgi:hypothetical protein
MDFFHKIKDWQAARGSDATMGFLVGNANSPLRESANSSQVESVNRSNFYRTIMIKYYGDISFIL